MTRLTSTLAAAVAFALLATGPAPANDSVASMGAGGLVLEKSDGITMLSEDLYVSAREVRVKYRFVNHTDEPIVTLVAFPMPDIEPGYMTDVGGRLEDPAHMVPFITWVEDRAVWTEVQQTAVFNGVDVTALLTALGLPLAPHAQSSWDALRALPETEVRALERDGLVDVSENDAGGVEWAMPAWTLRTIHYWQQYFHPGEVVEIEHLYAPAIGGTVMTMVGRYGDVPGAMDEYQARYCMDEAFVGAARRRAAAGESMAETWLDYVLTTGANWSGPIRDFRMVVDKGSPDNLVSFCAEGVRRISATQFEVRRTDYTPTRDLNVLILEGVRSTE